MSKAYRPGDARRSKNYDRVSAGRFDGLTKLKDPATSELLAENIESYPYVIEKILKKNSTGHYSQLGFSHDCHSLIEVVVSEEIRLLKYEPLLFVKKRNPFHLTYLSCT